jgi:hypothetical protein
MAASPARAGQALASPPGVGAGRKRPHTQPGEVLGLHPLRRPHPHFWAALSLVLPDYEERREGLRQIGERLVW